MKSSTRLDSAVFQLTPTRTRCDLVISANGKTEKIASGLVNPFLAHLKSAQDQMAKGGYSIILQPQPETDDSWFTRGTVERFVRFVSTPEILERVYTLESEILQIEEAIAIQSNNDIGLTAVDDHPAKSVERIEGSRLLPDSNEEKAIVLYQPGAHTPAANGSTVPEGNSKVQLMKVLETRKTVLQKEQGMAFARAVAAGFDIDRMAPLISFAETFGALRLMDACVRFMGLWKRKHETGQWVEIEAAEAMSNRSDFSTMNASGIVLSNAENNGKADEKTTKDQSPLPLPPSGHQEYFQGQYPLPMFPPWPIHSPSGGLPPFQGYPIQGIPYYQNYPGNSPVFQSPYPPSDDQRIRRRRHSMDSKDSNTEPEAWEVDSSVTRSQDDADLGKEISGGQKGGRPSKKQSRTVVIRNINYITSKRQDSSSSDSESASGSETDEEDVKNKNSQRSSKRKGSHSKSMDKINSSEKEETVYGKEADGNQWQAFQNYLLKDADEAERAVDHNMFAMEKGARVKRRQNTVGNDPLAFDGRDVGDDPEDCMTDMQNISGNLTRRTRTSNDELLVSRGMNQSGDGRMPVDMQSTEIDGRRGGYRRRGNDDFFVRGGGENRPGYTGSLAINGLEHGNNDRNGAPHDVNDDSYVVSLRSMSLDQVETDRRTAFYMDSELPNSVQRAENSSNGVGQVKYEPDALSLMPERGAEKGSIGYDPALDYDMEVHADKGASLEKKKKVVAPDTKQGSKRTDKDWKSRLVPDNSDKKKNVGPIRKGKPSKLSPLEEARARAERLRTFKADLQKMKKEKEEEEKKRLEALKLERQKRIAARGSSIPAQSATQQARKHLPTKLSPSAKRGSKFSDAEPGSSSPLQRFPIRTVSAGSSESLKASKSNRLSAASNSAGSRVSRSVSSLPEPKKENAGPTPDTKASMSRIRRLSEPKTSSSHLTSSVKPRNTDLVSKTKISDGHESKKISAIMNHDKSKAATLPELKIRTTKRLNFSEGKSEAKELSQKVNGSKSITTSEGGASKRNSDKISTHSDGDDNTVIEKTVVMLECEKPNIPTIQKSEENVGAQNGHLDNNKLGEKTEMSEYTAIRAPVSPLTMDEVGREPIKHQFRESSSAYQATTEKDLSKLSSSNVAEKPYQAPFARVSSLEDPCTGNSDYGKAPPTSLQTVATGLDNFKAHVSESLKLEKISENSDKPLAKESSKGFRRLLKFGRKSHAAGEHNVESDNVSVNGSEADDGVANIASSSEVHMLKNLISQDETPAATPQKTSRHFSLLSPFRSKTSEKKPTA